MKPTWWARWDGSPRPIRSGGTGEMVYEQLGQIKSAPARSEDGDEIPKQEEVFVVRYEKGIAYVRKWEDGTRNWKPRDWNQANQQPIVARRERTGNAMTSNNVLIVDMAILAGIFLLGLLAKLFPRKRSTGQRVKD